MNKKEKTATNNQWISTPVESEGFSSDCHKEKTEGNNEWTSTNKNPAKNTEK